MVHLIRKLREVIAAQIAPTPQVTALVPVYVHKGVWSQVRDSGSAIVKFYHYRCQCGQENVYGQSERDVTTTHRCTCGAEYNLLRSIDALDAAGALKVAPEALACRLDSLAIQRVAKPPQRRHVAVGDDFDGVVGYESADLKGLF